MTGDKRTDMADKRHLPQEAFSTGLLDYLSNQLLAIAHRVWGSRRGVFGVAEFDGDGANAFKVDNLPKEMLDGDGYLMSPTAADAEQIACENALGVAYYIAAKHCLIPYEVVRNPRTGLYHYNFLEDRIGVVADPTSVVEGAGVLEIDVDSVFEAGVSHAGRRVTVWLRAPRHGVEAVAIERDLVVAWSDGHNIITTSGLLGQPGGSASTTPADYQVAATGLTVRRNTDLRAEAAYAFLTILTGTGGAIGPANFNSADQVDVTSGLTPTLDTAYDGSLGGGSGRTVLVDAGAVEIASEGASSGDVDGAALRVSRLGSTEAHGIAAEILARETDGVTLAGLRALSKAGDVLLARENCDTLADGKLDLTRGGALDLTAAGLSPACDLARVDGTVSADGLYLLGAVDDADTVTLRNRDGTLAAFAAGESGEVSFLRAASWSAGEGFAAAAPRSEGLRGACSAGGNVGGAGTAAHRFFPNAAAASAEFYDDGSVKGSVTRGSAFNNKGHGEFRELTLQPDYAGVSPEKDLGIGLNLDGSSVNGLIPGGIVGRVVDSNGFVPVVFDAYGRIARGHFYEDDFHYRAENWQLATQAPPQFKATVTSIGAGGNVRILPDVAGAGGIVELISGDGLLDQAILNGPDTVSLRTGVYRPRAFFRAALASLDSQWAFLGLVVEGTNIRIGFQRDPAASPNWRFYCTDGANEVEVNTGVAGAVDYRNFYLAFITATEVGFWLGTKLASDSIDLTTAIPDAINLAADANRWSLEAQVQTLTAATGNHRLLLDYWSTWDETAVHGNSGNNVS